MIDLDDPRAISQADPGGMLGHILGLPNQIRSAWQQVRAFTPPPAYASASSIVGLGMGGSAIGGDLVRTIAAPHLRVPMIVVRDYELPAFVGPTTLVIASSHSGETEETLAAFDKAQQRGAMTMAIATGGTLLARAQAAGVPSIRFQYLSQPRAALGYSTVLLLGALWRIGLLPDLSGDVAEAAMVLEAQRAEMDAAVPSTENQAKQLAGFLHGKAPVIYAGALAEVARRWKGQINENSKGWSFFEVYPELNHNAVVGFEHPSEMRQRIAVVTLASDLDHQRTKIRRQITDELLDRSGIAHRTVTARGRSALAQVLSAGYVGDFASLYLALLYGVDPTPVDAIAYLKARLAQPGPTG